jgi:hypothetical protein
VAPAFEGVGEGGLGLAAGRGHEGLVVVQGDLVQDEVADARAVRPQQRLGVTGAALELQPHHRRAVRCGEGVGDVLGVGRRQGEGRREAGAVGEKRAPVDPVREQRRRQVGGSGVGSR